MRRKNILRNVCSLLLCFILLFLPIQASASANSSKTILPAIEGYRSEMIITENEFNRIVEATDVDGNHVRTIFNKITSEYVMYWNNAPVDLKSTPQIQRAPIDITTTVLGNYARDSKPLYSYATIDLREDITWQGSRRTNFVWRVIGSKDNYIKELSTGSYDDMPKDYGEMMKAVNALNDKCRELISLTATVAISLTALIGAAATGLMAIESLATGTVVATSVVSLLYAKSGLGDRLDDCEIAYQTFGNS